MLKKSNIMNETICFSGKFAAVYVGAGHKNNLDSGGRVCYIRSVPFPLHT